MLENISDLPPEQRHRIIEQLSSCVNEISSGRSEVRNKLRKILSRHRSFPDANWALPEQELIEQRARLTWGLLHSGKAAPGSDSNGQMTYEKLKSWIDKARELCEKLDRKEC